MLLNTDEHGWKKMNTDHACTVGRVGLNAPLYCLAPLRLCVSLLIGHAIRLTARQANDR